MAGVSVGRASGQRGRGCDVPQGRRARAMRVDCRRALCASVPASAVAVVAAVSAAAVSVFAPSRWPRVSERPGSVRR